MINSGNLSGAIFVMIGPGGAGKNAIMKAIIARQIGVRQLATATTRPMRADERQGREHLFISAETFQQMITNDELLEFQEVTPSKFYGIPRQAVAESLSQGETRIADIEVLGARALFTAFPDNVVQIFVTVPGETLDDQLDILKSRMLKRDDNTTNIEKRLERAKVLELPYQSQCDYVVVNDTLEHAIDLVADIIQQELKKRQLIGECS